MILIVLFTCLIMYCVYELMLLWVHKKESYKSELATNRHELVHDRVPALFVASGLLYVLCTNHCLGLLWAHMNPQRTGIYVWILFYSHHILKDPVTSEETNVAPWLLVFMLSQLGSSPRSAAGQRSWRASGHFVLLCGTHKFISETSSEVCRSPALRPS